MSEKTRKPDASARCKCGVEVLFFHAEAEAWHPVPECDWFKAQCASIGRERAVRTVVLK